MIELPRACFVADRIAEHADFFSFGTNDLTQTALGFSRDDVESKFVPGLHGAQDHRPLAVRDDRQAGRRLARAAGGVGGARGAARSSSSASAASTAATRSRSTSSTWPGSTTCPARRSACRSRAWRPRRPQHHADDRAGRDATSATARSARMAARALVRIERDHRRPTSTSPRASRRGRPRGCRRSPRRSYPARRARAEDDCGAAHAVPARPRPDRALARRSGGSSTRRRCSSRRRATTTARGSPTRSRRRRSRARSRGRCGSTRTWRRRSGSGTTSATRRSGTSARTCWTAAGASASARGFRHNEHSLRVVDVLEGLNLTEPVRDGILRHSSGAGEPATLEGKIVRLVDRIAYINHDIDDALRAGVLALGRPAGGGDRGARADRARGGSTRWCTTSSSTPSAAGDIVQGDDGRPRDAAPALVHVRARLPRADARGPSTRRSSGCCAGCSTGTASTRRSCRAGAPAPTEADRVIDYLAGMTDRFAIRAWTERFVPQGLAALMARYTARVARARPRRGRLRGARRRADRAASAPGTRRLQGLCPFHDERTPSFGIDPVEKLYHCFGCGAGGDVFKFVMETEGLDFGAALESLAERYGVELEREAEDPRDGRRAASGATACSRCWSAPRPTTCACCGSRGEAARRARVPARRAGSTEDGAARVPRRLRAVARGTGCSMASRRAGYTEEELLAAGLAQRSREGAAADRPLPRADHVPAGRRARPRARASARARCGDGPAAEVPQHLATASSSTRAAIVYGADLARAAAARGGRGSCSSRATPT